MAVSAVAPLAITVAIMTVAPVAIVVPVTGAAPVIVIERQYDASTEQGGKEECCEQASHD
jgi:hypothetical protein